MVGINVPIPVPVAYYSFGGWKDSLFGDTHMYGPEGINFYTRGKVVTSALARPGHVDASTSASRAPAERRRRHDRARPAHRRHGPRRPEATQVRALDRAHVFHSWSAQGLIDPLPIAVGAGLVLPGLRRQALPRLLQPAGQRQHRLPAPEAGRGDPGAGRPADARSSRRSPTTPAARPPGSSPSSRPGDLEPGVLHQRRRRGDRERDAHGPAAHRPAQGARRLPQLPRRHRRRDHADRRPAPLGRPSPAMPGVVHYWGPYPYRSAFHADDRGGGVRARAAAPARH